MKILILYTTRCGTNSIADYFMKQNKDYTYFNQPFSSYVADGIVHTTYDECIGYSNVLVKSEITKFNKLNIDSKKVLNDFDKVLLISRKNKREQSISYLIAQDADNFLDRRKRAYYTDNIEADLLENTINYQIDIENILRKFESNTVPFFYYEELYYGDFSKLFEFLNIKHIDEDFKNILDTKHKYNHTELYSKKTNTVI